MANLTETQVQFRRTLVIIVIMAFGFYTGRFILFRAYAFYLYMFPTEAPAPASAFGTLPALKMPSTKLAGNPQYVLDTREGMLPNFPDRLYVYKVKDPVTNLLSEQTIKNLATDLTFSTNFIKNGASKLKWIDGTNDRTFTADIITKNFQLTTGIEKLTTVVNQSLSIRNVDAEESTLEFIKSKSLMNPNDSQTMYTVTTPSMVVLGRLRASKLDPQMSKLMKVDVFREIVVIPENTETKQPEIRAKVLGPNPKNSLINFYVTNAAKPFQNPIINYTYWDTDYATASEYYLTPVNSIWALVSQNNGIISYVRTENEDYFEPFKSNLNVERVEIKDVYMAYYEAFDYQPYLQPIYVFEGTFVTKPESGRLPENGEIVI